MQGGPRRGGDQQRAPSRRAVAAVRREKLVTVRGHAGATVPERLRTARRPDLELPSNAVHERRVIARERVPNAARRHSTSR